MKKWFSWEKIIFYNISTVVYNCNCKSIRMMNLLLLKETELYKKQQFEQAVKRILDS